MKTFYINAIPLSIPPEDFDSTKWDAVNITELINTLSGRVDLIHGVYHSETETIEFA